MKLLIFLCLVGAVLCKKKSETNEKLKVAVYYEALCPDSMSFITRQLYPAWQTMHGAIRVKLIPYGKAIQNKKNHKWVFECQHGPRECLGNKIQGCILKSKTLSDEQKFDLVNCLMADRAPDTALPACATRLSVDQEPIMSCTNSSKGDDILASYGEKTAALRPNLAFVPTIVFNEKFNQDDTNAALTDLKGVICRLSTRRPAQCPPLA